MSEYWKSTPKYWCKHCSTYVRDTPFERRQHESTAKHQSSLKRFLRDIQNNHERAERDKARAKAEVERLNKIAGAPSASTKPAAPLPATVGKESGGQQRTAEDQKRQWQQLADMGIKVPGHVRTEMAMAGDWQAVRQPSADLAPEERLSVGVRKRKADDDEEEDDEQGDHAHLADTAHSSAKRKVWGRSVKHLPAGDEDGLDALLATSSIPLKTDQQQPDVIKDEGQEAADTSDAASNRQHGGNTGHSGAQRPAEKPEPQAEEPNGSSTSALALSSAPEPATTAAPVFKKRKPKGKS